MSTSSEFLNKRTAISCLVFSLPVSLLFMWRFTSLRGIPFFSADAWKIYGTFVVVDFLIFLLVFYILYRLSKRKQED